MIATECGILSTAVLRRDKFAVQMILNQRPQLLKNEKNIFGYTPIHLAIGWRNGLELLLKAADHCLLHQGTAIMYGWDCRTASTPLDFAIAFGCAESIRLLADAETAFDIRWYLFVRTDVWEPDVSNVVLDIIIERLRQLLEFGRQELPADIFASLEITGFDSFDSKARELLNALHAESISLPPKFKCKCRLNVPIDGRGWKDFWLPHGGFYHQPGICPNTAMALFQAGFTHVDTEAMQVTPLANLRAPFDISSAPPSLWQLYFPMVEFLVERGARLDRRISSWSITPPPPLHSTINSYQVIHRIASIAWMGAIGFGASNAIAIAQLGASQMWHQILQSNASDPCICACASGGCRPISLAVKLAGKADIWRFRQYARSYEYKMNWTTIFNPHKWDTAVELLFTLTLLLDDLAGEQLAEDVIRFLTFSALGLTHTCCSHVAFPSIDYYDCRIRLMDPNDVEEIREEEDEMIRTLDCLVDGFMADFRETGLPLSDFLLGRWQETMLAELTKKDEIPKGVMEQLDELGVVLYSDSSSDDNEVGSYGDDSEEESND
jgi:hypothetical protein